LVSVKKSRSSIIGCDSDFLYEKKYSILDSAMTKRKTAKFNVTKAVKANARVQVGQPKPGRVVDDRPKVEGRESKHKPTLADLLHKTEFEKTGE
jgi:hypothetical protein